MFRVSGEAKASVFEECLLPYLNGVGSLMGWIDLGLHFLLVLDRCIDWAKTLFPRTNISCL